MLTITYSRGSKTLAGAASLKHRIPVLPDLLLLNGRATNASGSNPVIHN